MSNIVELFLPPACTSVLCLVTVSQLEYFHHHTTHFVYFTSTRRDLRYLRHMTYLTYLFEVKPQSFPKPSHLTSAVTRGCSLTKNLNMAPIKLYNNQPILFFW